MIHDPPVEISPSSDGQKAASAYPSQAGSFGKLLRHNPISLPSHSLKQWGQLGEILGGVRFPECGASRCAVRRISSGSGAEQSQYKL